MDAEQVVTFCLVVRGVSRRGIPTLCLRRAAVEIYGRRTRKRLVCAACADRLFDLHDGRGIKMKILDGGTFALSMDRKRGIK